MSMRYRESWSRQNFAHALQGTGFRTFYLCSGWYAVILWRSGADEIRQAKEIVNKPGLTVDELLFAVPV